MKIIKVLLLSFLFVTTSQAKEVIGKVSAKGLLSKDKIEVIAFKDPEVSGVTCYTTYYDRSWSFNDSTSSSISCRKTGPINITNVKNNQNVFSQSKSFFSFKKTKVARMVDRKNGAIIYLSYTEDVFSDSKSASHSISVVVYKD